MSNRAPTLTEKDYNDMDNFLGAVLDDYKNGVINKADAVGHLAHVIGAIDKGNYGEATNWFRESRKFIRREHANG